MTIELNEADVTEAKDAAKAATTPTAFNFAETILDRSYPEFEVPIYLDEKKVQEMLDLDEEIDTRETIAVQRGNDLTKAKDYNDLVTKRDKLRKELWKDHYTVKVRGISPEYALKIEDEAVASFPEEFEENQNPITGQPIRTPIENEKRDEFISMRYRQAHLISVTSPDGAVDSDFADIEKVRVMYARLPYVARVKIDGAVQKATIATDFYREITDEVF